ERPVGVPDERLAAGGPDACRADAFAQRLRVVLDQRAQDRLLVGVVVVEGAARQLRAADDVPHRCRAVAELGEHLARGIEDRAAVVGLGALALAAGRDPYVHAATGSAAAAARGRIGSG